jgi:hypothetical protein
MIETKAYEQLQGSPSLIPLSKELTQSNKTLKLPDKPVIPNGLQSYQIHLDKLEEYANRNQWMRVKLYPVPQGSNTHGKCVRAYQQSLMIAYENQKFDHELNIMYELSIDSWIAVEDNPVQRNTEARLHKAKHLREYHPTHRLVHMVELPDGKRIKLDGHTRALSWKSNRRLAPPDGNVTAHCIFVKDRARAEELYFHYDNPRAAETAVDRVSGGYRKTEFSPQSPMLKAANIATALRIATAHVRNASEKSMVLEDTHNHVSEWVNELRILDSLEPSANRLIGPFLIAALLTLRNRPGPVMQDFWKRYCSNQGSKDGLVCDAVQALEITRSRSKEKKMAGRQAIATLSATAVSCAESFYKGHSYSGRRIAPRETTLSKYGFWNKNKQED